MLTTFLNLSKDAKLMREDNLKLARVLLVHTKAPEAVVVVVVVLPGFFTLAALLGLCAEKRTFKFHLNIIHIIYTAVGVFKTSLLHKQSYFSLYNSVRKFYEDLFYYKYTV